jgi:hypothetical protein
VRYVFSLLRVSLHHPPMHLLVVAHTGGYALVLSRAFSSSLFV